MKDMTLHFIGPFTWPGAANAPSIFETPLGQSPGIYLWAVPQQQDELVYYVGETGRSFATRMAEHYKEHAAGFYHLNSPEELSRGRRVMLWPGHWDREHPASVVDCIRQSHELASTIRVLSHLYHFYVAPLDASTRTRKRIEAAIARALYASPDPVGSFQETGIHYEPRKDDEAPITCRIVAPNGLRGLPEAVEA
jgi:hypothetical protein